MPAELIVDTSAAVESIGAALFPEPASNDGGVVDQPDPPASPEPVPAPAGTPASPAASPAPTPAAPAATPPSPPAPAAATPAPAPRAVDINVPPMTWRDGPAKAAWATLPEDVRAEVYKREEDMFAGIEGYKADAGAGKAFKTVLAPFLPILQRHNIDPGLHVKALLEAQHTLALGTEDQKVALFQRLAQDYRIPMNRVVPAAPVPGTFVDPAVEALQNELNTVKTTIQTNAEVQQRAALAENQRTVDAFAADPAHPHFHSVANRMVELMESGAARGLQAAYETAVWENPVTRKAEIDRQQAEASAAAAATAATQAEAAKAAQAANVRSSAKRASAGTAAKDESMQDTIAATLKSIKERDAK